MLIRRIVLLVLLVIATPLRAQRGLVSAADPRAAAAGAEILRAGGSAADAAMAVMLALSVVEPQSSGIGGGGFLLYHDAATGQPATLDGRETAPSAAKPDRFLRDGKPLPFMDAVAGGLSVGVPGNIALMARAHARWGKLPWPRLFDPAIRLAEQGYVVTPRLAESLAMAARLWADFPDARAIYWQGDRPKRAGERITNPALAETLRRIAAGGPDEFYRGETARMINRAVGDAPRNPATLSLADLAGYKAIERAPICRPYRLWKICGMGPPSSGATTVLGILGMLERFDLKRLGKDSPAAWHLIGEAMRLAYADRALYLGDADHVAVPVAGLVDRGYLATRAALISPIRTRSDYPAGTPPGAPDAGATPAPPEHGTTHFVVRDRAGNVASMTSTVEGPFGSQLIAGGMILNNELTDFNFVPEKDGVPAANRLEPGKRPLSSMAPTLVYDAKGRLMLALGSAGGKRIIMHVTKTLIGVLDWGLPVDQAITLPNIFYNDAGLMLEQGTALADMLPKLLTLGEQAAPAELTSKVNALQWVKQGWRGAADQRSEGVTVAE